MSSSSSLKKDPPDKAQLERESIVAAKLSLCSGSQALPSGDACPILTTRYNSSVDSNNNDNSTQTNNNSIILRMDDINDNDDGIDVATSDKISNDIQNIHDANSHNKSNCNISASCHHSRIHNHTNRHNIYRSFTWVPTSSSCPPARNTESHSIHSTPLTYETFLSISDHASSSGCSSQPPKASYFSDSPVRYDFERTFSTVFHFSHVQSSPFKPLHILRCSQSHPNLPFLAVHMPPRTQRTPRQSLRLAELKRRHLISSLSSGLNSGSATTSQCHHENNVLKNEPSERWPSPSYHLHHDAESSSSDDPWRLKSFSETPSQAAASGLSDEQSSKLKRRRWTPGCRPLNFQWKAEKLPIAGKRDVGNSSLRLSLIEIAIVSFCATGATTIDLD